MYTVNLIRRRNYSGDIWVDTFDVDDNVKEAEQAFRSAVKSFLATDEGKQATKVAGDDFNWGDAVNNVTDSTWRAFGLSLRPAVQNLDVIVDQDEVLCAKQ